MKKILIIEDERVTASVYKYKLQNEGYKVEVASDGEEGLAMLSSFKPDLVQLDLQLPKVSGLEVLRHIRAHPALKDLPVIVLSNLYNADLARQANEAGATQCLTKLRCSPLKMLDVVKGVLESPAAAVPAPAPAQATAPAPAPVAEGPAAAPPPPEPASLDESALPSEIRKDFASRAPQYRAELSVRLVDWSEAVAGGKSAAIDALGVAVRSLAGYASLTKTYNVAHLASALDAMLAELVNRPVLATPSTPNTIWRAVKCLLNLLEHPPQAQEAEPQVFMALAVDDEPISRRALVHALNKAHLKSVGLDDSGVALKVAAENRFDLIFMDVEMPGMDGLRLCAEIRKAGANQKTPVVFVTSHMEFKNQELWQAAGGTDFIAKPITPMELAVKALTCVNMV